MLLDAVEQVMLEEGYAAVSSRRVASRAGLKPQLVHYYFRTMDDLFLAAFRRMTERAQVRHTEALASDRPLRALWEISRHPAGTALIMEFSALANHRKSICAEISRYGGQVRDMHVQALASVLNAQGVAPDDLPPTAAAVLIASTSLFLRMEEGIGLFTGHADTEALIERWIARLEPPADDRT